MQRKYHYFVEGKCEKKLIDTLKEQKNLIVPGRVEVYNVTQKRLTELKLRPLSSGTIIILVFDTDTAQMDILKENIKLLSKSSRFKDVWCLLQVKNFEDEIIRSTVVRNVKDIFKSENLDGFKEDFIKEKNLYRKLCDIGFDLAKMWVTNPDECYCWLENDGDKIKK